MAAKRKKQTSVQPVQDERHYRAVAAAQVGVAKRGPKTLSEQLNRGRAARFEKQVEEMFPGLRDRDPNDFAARVQALNKAHMAKCTAASIAAKRNRAQKCPWCRAASGESWREQPGDEVCAKHAPAVNRHGKRVARLAQQAYRQSA